MSILKRQHSCVWVAAAYKRSISNSKTVLNFCNKMGYGRVTKLVHAPRNHQSFINESFTNYTHQTKRVTEFQRQKLSNEFRDYFESIYQKLIEKFRIRFIEKLFWNI